MITYKMYELPGCMACGNCGFVMPTETNTFDEEMRKTGIAKYSCTYQSCSDKGKIFTVKLKVHEISE